MRVLKNPDDIAKAILLAEVNEEKRNLERQEKKLKEYFKGLRGDEMSIRAGEILFTFTECHKTELDKEKVQKMLGDKIALCEVDTTYFTMDIRKA